MSEVLQEFVDSGSERLRVDREAGVIRGVKLLGLVSRNGRHYRERALCDAVGLYEGAKVNINHPKGHPLAPRDYQDRLGAIRGVTFRPGQGLFGDLYFNPKHALSEQLVWDAQHAPQNVGLSHNVAARTTRNGEVTVVEAITKVQSIDLVADPATTGGLYEHAQGAKMQPASESPPQSWSELSLESLRRCRPDLLRAAQRETEAQLEQVRGELAALATQDKKSRRRERILDLLEEHDLPLPTSASAVDSQLVDARFIETLMRAADDETVRQLVEERAKLVRSAWQWTNGRRTPPRRPQSRDQLALAPIKHVHNGQEFAAAIRGR